jgi:hypothetical protein
MRTTFVAALVGSLLLTTTAWAHHSFSSEFDVNKPIKLQGTIVKWEMVNPHSWFHIDVKNPDGTVTTWMIEGGTPNTLIRMGVTKNSIRPGTEITVEGYLAKDGLNKAVGRNFILADGTRLFLGGSAQSITGGDEPK